VPSHQDQVWTI